MSYQDSDASVLSVYGDSEWTHPEAQVHITEALIYLPISLELLYIWVIERESYINSDSVR